MLKSTDTIKELLLLYLALICVCSLLFVRFEGMAFGDAVWMSFVAATSTGFGDFYPKTTGGRITCVLLMHFSLFLIVPLLIARLISVAVENKNEFTDNEQEEILSHLRKLTKETRHANEQACAARQDSRRGNG